MFLFVLICIFLTVVIYTAIAGAFYQYYFRSELKRAKSLSWSDKEGIKFTAMFWPVTAPFVLASRFVDKKFNNEETKQPNKGA